MLIALAAVVLGAGIGWVARGRSRALLALAIATPILAVAALAAQWIPGGAVRCTSTDSGPITCQALPAVSGWSGLAFAIAFGLCVLALAPIISLRTGSWVAVAVSAVLQLIPQIVSFGGFLAWAPALLTTVAVAFALAVRPRTVGVQSGGAPS